jgi:hypothetical protein
MLEAQVSMNFFLFTHCSFILDKYTTNDQLESIEIIKLIISNNIF